MAETTKIPEPPPSGDKAVRQKAHGDIEDFDDDDLDFEDTFGDSYGMTVGMRVVSFLAILGAAAMIGYLILLVIYPEQFSPQDWIGASSEKTADDKSQTALKGFELGGIYLGMTPDEARRVYPSLKLEEVPGGEKNGFFLHHEGEYRITFRPPERGQRAYQVQSLHYFPRVSYLELLTEVTGRYGKPTRSDCGAPEDTIAILCRLHWKMIGVKLDAEIRTSVSERGTEARTALRVTATDTRRDSAFRRRPKKTKRRLQDINPNK